MDLWNLALLASFVVFWAGYYPALWLAWRTGVSRGPLLLAGLVGACGCFGMPILGWLLVSTQRKQLEQLMGTPDIDVARAQRENTMSKAFVAVAAVGFAGQIAVANFAPEPSASEDLYGAEYDDATYAEPSEERPTYAGSSEEAPYAPPEDLPTYAEPSEEPPTYAEPGLEEAPPHDPRVFTLPPPDTDETLVWEGWTLTMSGDRRRILLLDGRSPRALVVESTRPLPRRALGDFVRVEGTAREGVVRSASVRFDGRNVLDAIPRPRRLALGEVLDAAESPSFVVLRGLVAIDSQTLAAEGTTEPTLHVVAPRGTLHPGDALGDVYGVYFAAEPRDAPATDESEPELWWVEGASALP